MFWKATSLFSLLPALMVSPHALHAKITVEKATLAGGCFWCMVHPFEKLEGVLEVKTGYTWIPLSVRLTLQLSPR